LILWDFPRAQPGYAPPPVAQSALPGAVVGGNAANPYATQITPDTVIGGLVGSRFGQGNGKTAAAALGVAVGAMAGPQYPAATLP